MCETQHQGMFFSAVSPLGLGFHIFFCGVPTNPNGEAPEKKCVKPSPRGETTEQMVKPNPSGETTEKCVKPNTRGETPEKMCETQHQG